MNLKKMFFCLGELFVLVFTLHLAWAQCPQAPIDLGMCDSLYVEVFDCDHYYDGTAGYDSVRISIYVTHDSNTFWWSGGNRWIQDSIATIVVPLLWWKEGCADSVVLPTYGNWNNLTVDRSQPNFKRSIFRDLVDAHSGDTIYNRYTHARTDLGWSWFAYVNFNKPDSAMLFVNTTGSTGKGRWWEGNRVLLATLTFLVYMSDECDSTAICFDSTSWRYGFTYLEFVRYDAYAYVPRHFLPVCDVIYPVTYGDCNNDGVITAADVVYLINYLFIGGPVPAPLEAGDVNCDGTINASDVVYLINYLFISGPPPGC